MLLIRKGTPKRQNLEKNTWKMNYTDSADENK
jgi:hypothetical protein